MLLTRTRTTAVATGLSYLLDKNPWGADPLRQDKRDEFHKVVDLWGAYCRAFSQARSFKMP